VSVRSKSQLSKSVFYQHKIIIKSLKKEVEIMAEKYAKIKKRLAKGVRIHIRRLKQAARNNQVLKSKRLGIV